MNEFSMPPEGSEYITTLLLENPTPNPIHIMSGENKELNKKILYPRQRMQVNIRIPAGKREFIKEQNICGKQVLYVGTVDADFVDPFVFNLDN